MFQLLKKQNEYHHVGYTTIPNLLDDRLCDSLNKKILDAINSNEITLVDHQGKGSEKELDGGGKYLHHIFLSEDIDKFLPELKGAYHALLPLVSMVTSTNTILSPHEESDINIKSYPPKGGTIGAHFDTNGITALLYLTDNPNEGHLKLRVKRSHPSGKNWVDNYSIASEKGMLLLMQGRKIWHWSDPTINQLKNVVVFNYYEKGDTWRPKNFDQFVYEGQETETKSHDFSSLT